MMNIVLLSGGSGKRLWPLSNDVRSKQFIKLFKNEDGTYESMVQRMYRQIKKIDRDATITIATSKTQVSSIQNQLQENVGISLEPCRRDTFPAIALAAEYLKDILHVGLEETVVVCPVDPYVNDDYFEALKKLSQQAEKGEANLVLMGIEPTYPSEKYGYIIPESVDATSKVSNFKEKPTVEVAKQYIEQGALWNGGVFAFKLGYLIRKAHQLIDYTDYQDMFDRYAKLPKISFDYAVVEKEDMIQVQRFGGQWKDLGTWNTLTEAMEDRILGKGVMNDNCENVHILNEDGTIKYDLDDFDDDKKFSVVYDTFMATGVIGLTALTKDCENNPDVELFGISREDALKEYLSKVKNLMDYKKVRIFKQIDGG